MKIRDIFTYSDVQLKGALAVELVRRGYDAEHMYNTKDFLYAEGNAPYMLIAHLDTVHKQLPSIICYSADGNYIMSPQGIGGDDRCGVYIILSLLRRLPFRPYILFTMGEEKGGLGAKAFIDFMCEDPYSVPDLKFIVEYDRKGNNDCVFYRCDNPEFTKFVEGFGFKEATGSFSDISVIAPEFGVAAVNLSSGYFNPHKEHEYVCVSDMHNVIEASVKMLTAECEPFEFIEKKVTTYVAPKRANSSIYRQVSVTVLPAHTVYIKFYQSGSEFENLNDEVAIDANGNFYRYYRSYKDWEITYNVTPIDPDFKPKYDAKKSKLVPVYNYACSYYD